MVRAFHTHAANSSLTSASGILSALVQRSERLGLEIDLYGLFMVGSGLLAFLGTLSLVFYFVFQHQGSRHAERGARFKSILRGADGSAPAAQKRERSTVRMRGESGADERGDVESHLHFEGGESMDEDSSADDAATMTASMASIAWDMKRVNTRGGNEREVRNLVGGAGGELVQSLLNVHKKERNDDTTATDPGSTADEETKKERYNRFKSIGGGNRAVDELFGGANDELRRHFQRIHSPADTGSSPDPLETKGGFASS